MAERDAARIRVADHVMCLSIFLYLNYEKRGNPCRVCGIKVEDGSYHFYVKGGLICLIAGLVSFVPEIRSFVPELGRRHIYVIKHHLPSYGKVSYTFIRFLHRASFYVINNHGRIRASLKIIDHAGRIHISYSIMCHKLHMTS